MKNDNTRCTGHERVKYWNIICEKDKIIAYYQKTAELATNRKKQAIRNSERRAKLNFSYAALILAGMMVIPWVLWLFDGAMKAFWLWANGR